MEPVLKYPAKRMLFSMDFNVLARILSTRIQQQKNVKIVSLLVKDAIQETNVYNV